MSKTILLYAVSDKDRKEESRQANLKLDKKISAQEKRDKAKVAEAKKARKKFIKEKGCKPHQAPLHLFLWMALTAFKCEVYTL